MLVVFEGLDGTGKSTLINEVAKRIDKKVFLTKEPGSPSVEINKLIRNIVLTNKQVSPMSRELLFYADALEHKRKLVEYEHSYDLIMSDRGKLSHRAYAYGLMATGQFSRDPDANYSFYSACKKLIELCCAEPDLVIYLEGDVPLMRSRAEGKDVIEINSDKYFNYVLIEYESLVENRKLDQKPVLNLDARASLDENTEKAIYYINEYCAKQVFRN